MKEFTVSQVPAHRLASLIKREHVALVLDKSLADGCLTCLDLKLDARGLSPAPEHAERGGGGQKGEHHTDAAPRAHRPES
jgi:hypothetical protein